MVAQNRVNPVARPQTPKQLRCGPDVPTGIGDEIARQGNNIRMEAVCLHDGLGEPLFRQKQTMVNVRNLYNAQAGECAGECIEPNPLLIYAEPVAGTPSVEAL